MFDPYTILAFILGIVLGVVALWLFKLKPVQQQNAVHDARLEAKETELQNVQQRLQNEEIKYQNLLEEDIRNKEQIATLKTTLEEERKSSTEKLAVLDDAKKKLEEAFKALSVDALEKNTKSFLELANEKFSGLQNTAKGDLEHRQKAIGELVKPLAESLTKVDSQLHHIEKARESAYSALQEQIKAMAEGQQTLRSETSNLVNALRAPTVRGRWGEIQLKRVVEMAGMLNYCDFVEQSSVDSEDGKLRPDLIVKLPNDKNIVVDAKTPLQSYLEAHEATDEQERERKLKNHAANVGNHIRKLSAKSYWDQFSQSPEFVILFMSGETFYNAALQYNPSLIEEGVRQKVLIATPTTLIALLQAVAYGWRQEQIAANAQEISNLGKTLYERINSMTGHLMNIKKGIDRTVDSYNKAVGSFESRVLVSARKFKELGSAGGADIPSLEVVEKSPRKLTDNPDGSEE